MNEQDSLSYGSMTNLKISLLGHPQVWMAGNVITNFHSNKARALLYHLVASRRTQARAVLASLFWGEFPESNANNNLRKTLSNLRGLVGDYLVITRESVTFNQNGGYWLDVAAFEQEVLALRSAGDIRAGERALEIYKGDFLEGFYINDAPEWESWTASERLRLREKQNHVLYKLAELYAGKTEYNQAIALAQNLVSLEPLREDVHRLLMALYAQNHQRVRALEQYERLCKRLDQELGVSPAVETEKLYQTIHSGELRFETGIHQESTDFASAWGAYRRPGFLDDEDDVEDPHKTVFVGREAEIKHLIGFLDHAIAGEGQVAFITGEAGRGKTALMAEFARRAQARYKELIIASGNGNAFSGMGDPFHLFHEVLDLLSGDVESRWLAGTLTREQARRLWNLVPQTAQALATGGKSLLDLFVDGPALLQRASAHVSENSPWLIRLREIVEANGFRNLEHGQLIDQFTNVLTALAGRHPLVLLFDDLQWSDNASLDLLFHLSRQLSAQPIFILGAYRPSDVALDHPATGEPGAASQIQSLMTEMKRRFGYTEINLERISPLAEREFVDALIDSDPNRLGEAFRHRFYQRTRGHPLFSIELLREMKMRDDLIRDREGMWKSASGLNWELLPARIEAVISQRITRLDEALREILSVASVEGERFTAQVVTRVLERDEREILHQLAHLQRKHRLVRELGETSPEKMPLTRYQFNHILFQQYLYQDLGEGERRLLHGRIAATLEELYKGHEKIGRVSIAQHYSQAGMADKAIPYLVAAGDRARTQYAHREAIENYQQALVFLKQKGDYEEAARTLMKIGLTYHNAFDFKQARAANQEAFDLWKRVSRKGRRELLPKAPHALRVAWRSFSGQFDPAMVKETPRALLMQQLFSGLVRLGQDLEILPDLAHGWDVLDNGQRYVFYLRSDTHWSDGVPVTAADFEFAWKRVLDPATSSPNAGDLFVIKGGREFHLGRGNPDEVGVKALDDTTLQIELEGISPYFPNTLFVDWAKPIPHHIIQQFGAAWTDPEKIVTNGPFRLVSWKPGDLLVMARNPYYHGRFTGNVEQVELYLGDDQLHQLDLYLADKLDVLYTFAHLPPEIQAGMRAELASEYRSGPDLGTWFVGFVLNRPPFNDRRVRRALALATDRNALARVVRRGSVQPASGGFLSPVHAAYSEGIALPFDPQQARRLLADAGYPGGQGFPTVELLNGHASQSVEADLHYLQKQWRQQLGVDMVWETVWEMSAFLRRIEQDPPHLFYEGWTGPHTDPDDFLRQTTLIWQQARWRAPKYFKLVNQARMEADWENRMALYRLADRMLIEEVVLLPLTYSQNQFLIKPWVQRFAYTS
ncbi:MAG: ABC transporter substrate-binding protein, partial [Anaerolineales bacterium]